MRNDGTQRRIHAEARPGGFRRIAGLALMPFLALTGVAAGQQGKDQRKPPAKPAPKPTASATAAAAADISYNRDIRPLLSDNCFACHGPDKNTRMAGLRLDRREDALAKGAITPGRPEKSALIARIFARPESGLLMPPSTAHKTLSAAQKDLLKRWVAAGAPYEPHWAYIPPKRPAVPSIADKRYPVRNPVDAFVMARLMREKILPSPEADKRTLIRRVSLDLIGIPPTPAEVNAFLADKSPNAYEKLVDRLLASPHYGERMAVPWLDTVRYADTVGFHGDQNQNAWAYRDYVINAFNSDKPYNRFIIEQVAGDLLPNATAETRTATCFNRMNMMTREGGAQAKEYLAKYSADRVRTVGMAFLGSTFACAECHDHKYDPITAKDFYSMAAFFADVKQWGVYADYGYTPNPDLRGYNNDYPFPPEIKVESRYLKERIARQQKRLTELAQGTAKALDPATFAAWRSEMVSFLDKRPDGWETPTTPHARTTAPAPARGAAAPARPAALPTIRAEGDGSVVVEGEGAANLLVSLHPEQTRIASLRLELLPDTASDGKILRKSMGDVTLTLSAAVRDADGKTRAVPMRHAAANLSEPRYQNGFEILGVHRGWRISAAKAKEKHVAVYLLAQPLTLAPTETLTVTLPNIAASRVRLSVSPFVPEDPDSTAFVPDLKTALSNSSVVDANATPLRAYLFGTAWNADAFAEAKKLEADIIGCRQGITPVLVTEAWNPVTTRVLPRGNWQDESGPVVTPAVPHFLPGYQANPGKRLNRLDLANWLASPTNPLTARVQVNRLWKQFFGNGLSAQVEDLGAQGEAPSHPELLDWLAVEFAAKRWSHKHIVRLLVTSATYRQSSKLRPELRDRDPNNRLLASQNPRRLEAEFVRDNALAVAGLLTRDIGGPSAKPYQPAGYYEAIQFPDRDYLADTDDRQWRRGVYMHWQRTFLHPMLANFDAPLREDALCTRTLANTPQQALTLLNDPSYVEAARVFAQSLLAAPAPSDAARLERAYQRTLARSPKPQEKASLLKFLTGIRAVYKERPDDAKKLLGVGIAPAPANADPLELAAWTNVCRVLLNLQETITRY
jgi:mono/diheme cytochrome c family protein